MWPESRVDTAEEEHFAFGYRPFNAARARAGVNGTRRMRAPVASKIAFATARAKGIDPISPAPFTGRSGLSTMSTGIFGTSLNLKMGCDEWTTSYVVEAGSARAVGEPAQVDRLGSHAVITMMTST